MTPKTVNETTHDLLDGEELEDSAYRLNVKLIGFNRGGPSFVSETLHVCAVCWHQTEQTYEASSETHRVLNRSLNPIEGVGLCVRCWSSLVRD